MFIVLMLMFIVSLVFIVTACVHRMVMPYPMAGHFIVLVVLDPITSVSERSPNNNKQGGYIMKQKSKVKLDPHLVDIRNIERLKSTGCDSSTYFSFKYAVLKAKGKV